jgi:hypothetical protein
VTCNAGGPMMARDGVTRNGKGQPPSPKLLRSLPIFKPGKVKLHVSREEMGNCGSFRPDGAT